LSNQSIFAMNRWSGNLFIVGCLMWHTTILVIFNKIGQNDYIRISHKSLWLNWHPFNRFRIDWIIFPTFKLRVVHFLLILLHISLLNYIFMVWLCQHSSLYESSRFQLNIPHQTKSNYFSSSTIRMSIFIQSNRLAVSSNSSSFKMLNQLFQHRPKWVNL